MDFDLVVAYDAVRGIGLRGDLPWDIPSDLEHFRELTTTTNNEGLVNAVMMGRITWESLVRIGVAPLKSRRNIVVTGKSVNHQGVDSVRSVDDGLRLVLRSSSVQRVFGIGGAQFYSAALKDTRVRRVYATEIDANFGCDTFFPELRGFEIVELGDYKTNPCSGVRFRHVVYQRPITGL